jgi:flagellar P-ring protein FlgI
MNNSLTQLLLAASLFVLAFNLSLHATKVQDITNIVGVRDNQLIGYGLIVGLQGTGDGTTSVFTAQSLANVLQSVNIKIDQNTIKSKNIAAVMVTAKLPSFGRQGDNIDVMVSSIGDAKSLEGGTLLLTPLKGLDGKIYSVSQGPLTVGGFNAGGGGGGQKNHTTVGRVIDGGVIEREISYDLYSKTYATLSLIHSSFENAVRIQDVINEFYEAKIAVAKDPRTIKLKKPSDLSMIEFLATVEDLDIETAMIQKIIIDERTGTVISGISIEVKPVMITHGAFSIAIDEALLEAKNEEEQIITITDVTTVLQKIGAKPKDIISIIEAIKRAGALDAEVEII